MATRTKIAVLDDYQNVSLPHFQRLDESKFEVKIFNNTLLPYNSPMTPGNVKAELVKRLEPFTIICTMRERTPFPRDLLEKLPNLKLLLTTGTRNASLDLGAAKKLGIRVAGTSLGHESSTIGKRTGPDVTTAHTVALILGIARNIAADDAAVKAGEWQTTLATGLSGKTFGAVGLGRLGVNVAKILCTSFGMKIIAWSSTLQQEAADEAAKAAGLPIADEYGEKMFKVVSKRELFRTADVVSVHYVLSPRSKGIVAAADLALMKKSSFFVNTSRGPLVVEKDLLEVLKAGNIRGAALDVFDLEPLPSDSEWRTLKWGVEGRSRVLLTPHMGYNEEETLNNLYNENIDNLQRWLAGEELCTVLK